VTKFVDWLKVNPKLAAAIIALLSMLFGTLTGWTLSVQTGEKPGIIIVLPDGDAIPVAADARPVVRAGGEWVTAVSSRRRLPRGTSDASTFRGDARHRIVSRHRIGSIRFAAEPVGRAFCPDFQG
jgi:hypothetical protein